MQPEHPLSKRCACWLLMTRDRVGRNEFSLMHDLRAAMLDVRRAGVSVAAAALQRSGAIRYRRGKVVVLDEGSLARAACECYATNSAAFARLLRGGGDTD